MDCHSAASKRDNIRQSATVALRIRRSDPACGIVSDRNHSSLSCCRSKLHLAELFLSWSFPPRNPFCHVWKTRVLRVVMPRRPTVCAAFELTQFPGLPIASAFEPLIPSLCALCEPRRLLWQPIASACWGGYSCLVPKDTVHADPYLMSTGLLRPLTQFKMGHPVS